MADAKKAQHAHLTGAAKHKTKLVPGPAQLSYFIFEGVLTGFINSEFVHVTAFSGGAAGSKSKHGKPARQHTAAANNPYSYALKEPDDNSFPGGPLPPGSYQIMPPSTDPKLGFCARLRIPAGLSQVNGRDGFAIHGQGVKGSDGCIVIPTEHFGEIMSKLAVSKGGHLQVFQAMEASFG